MRIPLMPAILSSVLPLAAQAPAPPKPAAPAFQRFTYPEFGFSIETPGQMKKEVQQVTSGVGPVSMHIFSLEMGDDSALLASFTEYPTGHDYDTTKIPDSVIQGVANALQGTVEWQRPLSQNGLSGRECHFISDKYSVQYRLFFVNRRLYQLMSMTSRGGDYAPGTTRFFESFQILP